jgi:hypothetical protein
MATKHGAGDRYGAYSAGWTGFAGIMLAIVGILNLVDGFALLERKEYVSHQTFYSNLSFWGWAFVIWGALQLFAGVSLLAGRSAGRIVGTILSGLAIVLWFLMIFSEPWAAFVGVVMNMLILYALTVGSGDAWN